ncbi:MAG TPA: hypothetical protein PKE65_00155 [Rhizobiaceae bacterium]|nr:hypothetical protein [Rhizobiaceae bacterium]
MGEVVQFRGKLKSRQPRPDRCVNGPAELLFFTGVRYEKLIDNPVETAPDISARAKRNAAMKAEAERVAGRFSGR